MTSTIDWNLTMAAIWRQRKEYLRPVQSIDPISLSDLVGIEDQKNRLEENTRRFLQKKPVNNALLWGPRGTGKSSLIKALLNQYCSHGLRLVEVDKDDLVLLPEIVDEIRNEEDYRFLVYCDDLSFEAGDKTYKALKSALDGSIEQPPENVVIYATSNRRHLLPEYFEDNAASRLKDGEIHHGEAVEEKISLSDRFGLWIPFYPVNFDGYLEIVDSYFKDWGTDRTELHEAAKAFALARGGRSGRIARQFYNYFAERG